jgi:hypothetical protein
VKVENFFFNDKNKQKKLQCKDKDKRINLSTPERSEILNEISDQKR